MVGTADRHKRVRIPIDGEFTALATERILLTFMVLIAYLVQVARLRRGEQIPQRVDHGRLARVA